MLISKLPHEVCRGLKKARHASNNLYARDAPVGLKPKDKHKDKDMDKPSALTRLNDITVPQAHYICFLRC